MSFSRGHPSVCTIGDASRVTGYVLLETVIATGMLIIGLAVVGAQVQGAVTSVREMDLKTRAIMLADVQLAQMSMGLVEFATLDDTIEEEFGSRYPDWGWRMIIDETALDDLYQLTIEILYWPRESVDDDFDFDYAEVVHTVHTLRLAPRPLDLGQAFGMGEDEFTELADKLSQTGVEGLDAEAFDPTILAKLPFEDLIDVLPTLLDAFGIPLDQVTGQLPPEIRQMIEGSGLLDGAGGDGQNPSQDGGQ